MTTDDKKAIEANEPVFTPEGTLGPYYPGIFMTQMPVDLATVAPLLTHKPEGQPIRLKARFRDSLGKPVPSLVVESWQANAHGRYRHPLDRSAAALDPQFDGFARLRTDDNGVLELSTVKPGSHAIPQNASVIRAPHLRWTIFASGIDRLVTRIFFADEPLNTTDPVLTGVPDSVRERLIARCAGAQQYEIEIVMRGAEETPFFDDWY